MNITGQALADKIKELEKNDQFKKKIVTMNTYEEIMGTFAEYGVCFTEDELIDFLSYSSQEKELDEDELGMVAGGRHIPLTPVNPEALYKWLQYKKYI